MYTPISKSPTYGEHGIYQFIGLSTDTKPTDDTIENGSAFIEMDTCKIFFFDKENVQWLEFTRE